MSIPTCAVAVRLYDQQTQAVAGASVTAQLDRYEVHEGFVVPQTVEGITDQYGECTLNLWPNALGSQSSSYKIRINPPGSKGYSTVAMVPDALTANLSDIAQLPDIPGKTDFQDYFEQAQGIADDLVNSANAAKVAAQASAAAADGSATAAAGGASSAAAQAAAALASSQSATASANAADASRANAATSEANAAASAAATVGSVAAAAGSAATATAQAGNASASATAAAGSAATAGTQAGNASASAAAAGASVTNAAGSATAAATSATNAGNSATAANTSATNAAGSAAASATSAGNAAASATAAANSAASIAPTIIKPGDADATTGRVVSTVVIYNAAITATRTVTPNATNPQAGDTVRVTRTAAATGPYNVAIGALKNLAPGQYGRAFYDGGTWVLDEFGSL